MFGRLKAMGVDRDRIVPVAFHVDYFNAPWKDPFSQKAYSQRQFEYSLIYQRENDTGDKNTLYFTPMLMVDGRHPMLGSDPPKAQAALRRTLGEKPAASIAARLVNDPKDPRRKTLSASVAALTLGASGRDLLGSRSGRTRSRPRSPRARTRARPSSSTTPCGSSTTSGSDWKGRARRP